MVMKQWGYGINRARILDMDRNDMTKAYNIIDHIPTLQSCIACGACVATCTAGALTSFNLRKVHTLVRRGEYGGIIDDLNKCMLCGKCTLQCPRGINTRAVISFIKKELGGNR